MLINILALSSTGGGTTDFLGVVDLSFNIAFDNIIADGVGSLPDLLLNRLPVACACYDSTGKLVAANSKWELFFYIRSFTGLGLSLPDFQPCGTPTGKFLRRRIQEALKNGKSYFELFAGKKQERPIYFDIIMQKETSKMVVAYAHETSNLKAALAMAAERESTLRTHERAATQSKIEMVNRNEFLSVTNKVAETLLGMRSDTDLEKSLIASLGLIGQGLKVDCIKLWRAETTANLHPSLNFVCQWLSDLGKLRPQVGQSISKIKISPGDLPFWEKIFFKGQVFNGSVSSLPPEEQHFINEFKDVKSAIVIPVFIKEQLWGIFTMEDCTRERTLSSNEEMDIIVSACYMISSAYRQVRLSLEESERVRHANERVRFILDAAPLAINIFDENRDLIDCNSESVKVFGFSDRYEFLDYFSRDYFKFSPTHQPCGTLSTEKAVMEGKVSLENRYHKYEWLHLTKDGDELPVEVTTAVLPTATGKMLVTFLYDLREIKKAMGEMQRIEVAEESNRAKSRFLARMSHEIRTPITAVLGVSEIQLRSQGLPQEMEEAFSKIYDSAELLLNIVNDILDLSKAEAGKIKISNEKYDVANMINDILQMHHGNWSDKSFKFRLHVDEELPTHLTGDILRIEQIVNNILSNAFKYTESGFIDLSFLRAEDEETGSMNLTIIIKDTGFGMTQEQLDAMLNSEYSRFHENENRFISGTGLGMPIVFNMVQIMGASLDIESEVGTGTTVTIAIPQKISGSTVLGKRTARNLQQFKRISGDSVWKYKFTPEPMPYGRVLVVDDIEANLYVAKGLLEFYDLNVETCDSGHAAIEKVRTGNVYDIIFMDHMMPELNGTETLHIIRKLGYKEPVVALTANALIEQAESFIRHGFDDFISKPIQTHNLNELLKKYVRDKQPPEVIAAAKSRKITQTDLDKLQNSDSVQKKLRQDFLAKQKDAFADISKHLDMEDIDAAHIRVHTVKGLAGLILAEALQQVAEDVEGILEDGNVPPRYMMDAFERELTSVLDGIIPEGKEPSIANENKAVDKERIAVMFDELHPLLAARSSKSRDFIDELKTLPETAVIVRQMERFDFATAAKTLVVLKSIWEDM